MFILKSDVLTIGGSINPTYLARSRDNGKTRFIQSFERFAYDEIEFQTVDDACELLKKEYFEGDESRIKFFPDFSETKIYYLSQGHICDFAQIKYI